MAQLAEVPNPQFHNQETPRLHEALYTNPPHTDETTPTPGQLLQKSSSVIPPNVHGTEAKDHPHSAHHKRRFSFHSHKDTATPSHPEGSSTEAHQSPIFKKSSLGSLDFKELLGFGHHGHHGDDAKPHHHGHSHGSDDAQHQHHHGTRYRDIFGNEDADSASAQKARDMFGYEDVPFETSEKGHDLFGFEDVEFETTEKGHSLFGIEDQDTEAARKAREVFGSEDAANVEHRDVFGSEDNDDCKEEEEEEGGSERCEPSAHVHTMNII